MGALHRYQFGWQESWAIAAAGLSTAAFVPVYDAFEIADVPGAGLVLLFALASIAGVVGLLRINRALEVHAWGLVMRSGRRKQELAFHQVRSLRRRGLNVGSVQALSLELRLVDGQSVKLRSWLWAPAPFLSAIEADIQQRLMDKARDELGRGYAMAFGRLHCDRKGVQLDDGVHLAWSDVQALRLERGVLRECVEIVGRGEQSLKVFDDEIENLAIFSWLLAERGVPIARELTRAVSALNELSGVGHGMTGYRSD